VEAPAAAAAACADATTASSRARAAYAGLIDSARRVIKRTSYPRFLR
jgi:hypothetical protein